jgi:hypothetical protein
MKINDLDKNIKKIDEGIGDWLSRQGLRGTANKEAAINKRKDDLTYQIGLKNFKNEFENSLKRAIASGEVDPKKVSAATAPSAPTAPSAATTQPSAQAAAQQPIKIGGQTLDPNNPADKKIIDRIQSQQGGDASTQPASSTAQPESPEEKRIRKQMAATQTAQSSMVDKPANTTKSPAQVRAEKLATATQAAQNKMVTKSPESELPGFLQSKIKGRRPANESKKSSLYHSFDRLLEAAIQNQQDDSVSISDYLTMLFKSEVSKSRLELDSRSQNIAAAIIKQIESGFQSSKKIDNTLIEKLWNVLWSISKTTPPKRNSNTTSSSPVASNSPEAQEQRDQFFDGVKKKINSINIDTDEGTAQLAGVVAVLAKYVASADPKNAAKITNAMKTN